LPTLSGPEHEQPLILYVSATHSAVSGALVIEKEMTQNGKTAKQQFPVYFVSVVLMGSKRFYSEMEKICYAVIMSARKLHHYFEVDTVRVLTNQSMNDIFGNRDSSGRISKWAMELSEHVVDFEKRSAIKSKILAGFIAEWTEPGSATKVAFASVYHPPSNGAVKRANFLIFEAIKKILEGEKKGKWAEVMPTAEWSHNTTVCIAKKFTPFRLMYGAEAVLLEEIKHRILRTTTETTECPNKAEDKDLLESDRLKAVVNLEKYQKEIRAWRNPKVKL
jgi:hypothetical protein